jgi:hypothetical protein
LSQLTSLRIGFKLVEISTSSIQKWTRLTALESLTLEDCAVQPQALTAFTQLRSLSLANVTPQGEAPFKELLLAVPKLTLLTQLTWDGAPGPHQEPDAAVELPPPPAADCTSLTANTALCSLQVQGWQRYAPQGMLLFRPGTVYPNLRSIRMHDAFGVGPTADSQQQLEQLCSSCPAVESLSFVWHNTIPASCAPLLQLSALTDLTIDGWGKSAAVAAAVGVTAQLTGLKCLRLLGLPQLTDPALLQLTALTVLDQLDLSSRVHGRVYLTNKVSSRHVATAQRFAVDYSMCALLLGRRLASWWLSEAASHQ